MAKREPQSASGRELTVSRAMTDIDSSSDERFRSLFENSIDAMLLSSPEGKIEAANPAACRMFGRTEAEICRLGRDALVDCGDPRLAVFFAERSRVGSA